MTMDNRVRHVTAHDRQALSGSTPEEGSRSAGERRPRPPRPVIGALLAAVLAMVVGGGGEEAAAHDPTYEIEFEITTGPNAGPYAASEPSFTHPIYFLAEHRLNGPTVFGGYGCDADNDIPARASAGLRPLVAREEAIVVLEEGPIDDPAATYPACRFDEKVQNAEDAGYDGVLIARGHQGSELADDVACQDGDERFIPGACVPHVAMHRIFGETPSYERPYTRPNPNEPSPGQLGEDVRVTATEKPEEPGPTPPGGPQNQTQTPTQPTQPTIDRTRPLFTAPLRLRPRSFRARPARPRVGSAVGTRVRYSLSEPARVRFAVERARRGRKVGRRCVRTTRRTARRRPCTRYVKLRRRFSRRAVAGPNEFGFAGRLGGRALSPGRYRLVAVATDAAGNRSRTHRAGFRIARR